MRQLGDAFGQDHERFAGGALGLGDVDALVQPVGGPGHHQTRSALGDQRRELGRLVPLQHRGDGPRRGQEQVAAAVAAVDGDGAERVQVEGQRRGRPEQQVVAGAVEQQLAAVLVRDGHRQRRGIERHPEVARPRADVERGQVDHVHGVVVDDGDVQVLELAVGHLAREGVERPNDAGRGRVEPQQVLARARVGAGEEQAGDPHARSPFARTQVPRRVGRVPVGAVEDGGAPDRVDRGRRLQGVRDLTLRAAADGELGAEQGAGLEVGLRAVVEGGGAGQLERPRRPDVAVAVGADPHRHQRHLQGGELVVPGVRGQLLDVAQGEQLGPGVAHEADRGACARVAPPREGRVVGVLAQGVHRQLGGHGVNGQLHALLVVVVLGQEPPGGLVPAPAEDLVRGQDPTEGHPRQHGIGRGTLGDLDRGFVAQQQRAAAEFGLEGRRDLQRGGAAHGPVDHADAEDEVVLHLPKVQQARAGRHGQQDLEGLDGGGLAVRVGAGHRGGRRGGLQLRAGLLARGPRVPVQPRGQLQGQPEIQGGAGHHGVARGDRGRPARAPAEGPGLRRAGQGEGRPQDQGDEQARGGHESSSVRAIMAQGGVPCAG